MKTKTTLIRVICIILAAAMILGSGFYLVYIVADADSSNVAYGADSTTEAYTKLDRLKLIIQTIEENYKEDVDVSKLVDAAYDGVFDSLDPWTEYYATVDDEEAFTNGLENESYSGVGITIQARADGKIQVINLNPNGSGFEVGIKKGDVFTHVNGQSVEGWDANKLAETLRGTEGTTVKVTILRQGKSMDFTLTRKQLVANSVEYEILDNDMACITISNFNSGVASEFKSALDAIDTAGIKKLVIDLRDNPGGYANEALNCAALLLNVGDVLLRYEQKGEEIDTISVYGDSSYTTDYKISVLINENTASAAEMMAIALKGNDAAKLVGVTSYGKGVAQQIYSLSNGDSMKISTCYFVGPNNEEIDGCGIKPDYIVYNGAELSSEEISEIVSNVIPMDEGKKYVVKNAYGLNILAAQQRLKAMGYDVNINGILDDTTISCLSDVQKNAGVGTYGMLDFTTMKVLEEQYQSFLYGNADAQYEKAIELLK